MIPISNIANSIEPSLIRSLFNKAKAMDDVVDFTLGDPDVQPHQAIKDAACDAIQKGKTRYSQNAGLLDLRKTISEYYVRSEGYYYNTLTEILVSVGAMEGLYLTFLSMLDEGDEVIIPAPYYVNYVQMVQLCHAVPVIVDKPADEPLSFNVEDIEAAITDKTKVIIINTPSNPSGKLIPERKIQGIAALAQKYDLTVIADEVYKKLIYGDKPFKSIVAIEGMRERTVLINSLSKEFCMTGYRLGYVLAPEELIAAMTKLQENVAACAPLPSQYAGIEALSGKGDYSKNMVEVFTDRRNLLFEGLKDLPLIKPLLPEATFYMMVDISQTGMKSIEFAHTLLEKAHVAVVPAVAYGKSCDSFVRIAFTIEKERIQEGVRRIASFVRSLV
ncbi:MAG: aminotransferase class I/II-fold pyridoxal phosphate-dependent enzyme [Bacteroidales bacterium]|nr:aminotransferase class I/II-fold pyridoxal phosphate-dependent enzyme [Bacteroidales bacterium]